MAVILIDPKAAFPDSPRISASVGLPDSGASNVNSVASRPPNGYYVIIGCGPAAIINHTTLRQSDEGRKRLGMENVGTKDETPGLPVLHIGFGDPWKHYHAHGMGQPPYLLRMPGYHAVPDFNAHTIHTGLDSTIFAAKTDEERTRLAMGFVGRNFFVDGWVAAIEHRDKRFDGKPKTDLIASWKKWGENDGTLLEAFNEAWGSSFPPYRLIVVRPWQMSGQKPPVAILHIVYAHKIDICTGAGPMNVTPRDGPKPLFEKADRPPWIAPEYWTDATKARAVVHGMDGLTEATPWPADQRVCVYGAGGIGLNQVERARDVDCAMDWLATQNFDGTVNLYRNYNAFGDFSKASAAAPQDAMLEVADTGKLDQYKKDDKYLPAQPKWRFAVFSKCKDAVQDGRPLKLKLTVEAAKNAIMRDHFSPAGYAPDANGSYPFPAKYGDFIRQGASEAARYDRIVVCIGQNTAAAGEPSQITGPFGKPAILEVDSFAVGLQWQGGDIRALGAAAASYPTGKQGEFILDVANDATKNYLKGLPVSAVLPGFIRAGWSTAMANGYIGSKGRPNINVNTAPEADLHKALEKGGIPGSEAQRIAKLLVHLRMNPANGIPDFDTLKRWIDVRAGKGMKSGSSEDEEAAWLAATSWEKIKGAISMDYPPPKDL